MTAEPDRCGGATGGSVSITGALPDLKGSLLVNLREEELSGRPADNVSGPFRVPDLAVGAT